MSARIVSLLLALFASLANTHAQKLYFPPLSQTAFWDTVSPASLGWCTDQIQPLYDFLQQQNSKGFVVLKDGKIVLEKYFGTFTKDSIWYWASAGKTVTALLTGMAKEEGFLKLTDTVSTYLGKGWTHAPPGKENNITLMHQLTMTTGLDDGVPDNHCTLDTCLIYKADAGGRWAYHNAPYTLMEKVLTRATGSSINSYTQSRLNAPTGVNGFWVTVGYDNIFLSKVRGMARFGLLVQNHCIWDKDTLLSDQNFVREMTSTSQNLNLSYGYLWWLNGKNSYMVPGLQIKIPGSYAPSAPADMFAGLGKNGQIVSISRKLGLVVVRMGNEPGGTDVSFQLADKIWDKLNAVICNTGNTSAHKREPFNGAIYPNPAQTHMQLHFPGFAFHSYTLTNGLGQMVQSGSDNGTYNIESLSPGVYYLICTDNKGKTLHWRFVKQSR